MWEALEQMGWVKTFGSTGWMYASVSVIHYLTMFWFIGSMAVVDLRVMGVAARKTKSHGTLRADISLGVDGTGPGDHFGIFHVRDRRGGLGARSGISLEVGMIALSIVFAFLVQRLGAEVGCRSGNSELGKNHRRDCVAALDCDHSERVGNSGDGRFGIAIGMPRQATSPIEIHDSERKEDARYVRTASGFREMARGNSVGNRGPHFAVGVSIHPTGSFHRPVHLARDQSGAGLAAARAGKAPRNGRAASGRFVRLELDRLLHRRARRSFFCFPRPRRRFWSTSRSAGSWAFLFRWRCSGTSSCNGRRATGERRRTLRPSRNFRVWRKFCLWICVITAAVEIPNH